MQVHKLKDQQCRSRPSGSESALFAGAGHVQVQQGQGGTLCGYGEGKVKKQKKKKKKAKITQETTALLMWHMHYHV